MQASTSDSVAASQFSSLAIKLLIASANSQRSEENQETTRSYCDGGKFKIERQTDMGREGEPSEGQWRHRRKHEGVLGGGGVGVEGAVERKRGNDKSHLDMTDSETTAPES